MRAVPRIGRVLDAVGLALFVIGAAAFVWAWTGFRRVEAYQPPSGAPAWAAVSMADGYWRWQKVGVGLMLAGIVVFVAAWWVARKRRTATDESGTVEAR
jgi:small-conductance mechanosensitive channel